MKTQNKSNEPVRQHFVPKVYLKNFCDSLAKLHVYDKETGCVRSNASLLSVAVLKHLYTLTDDKGEKNYRVEECLSRLESEYGNLLKRVQVDGGSFFNGDNLRTLLWFLAFLEARNPRRIKIFEYVGLLLGENPPTPRFQRLLDPQYNHDSSMSVMRLRAVKIFRMMQAANWVMYVSDKGNEFVTTDAPMAGRSYVSLSSHALLVCQEGKGELGLPASPDVVDHFNTQLASNANRFVYASDKSTLERVCLHHF